jgi:hypothetical protein
LITGRDATLRFNDGVTNDGAMALSFGTSDVSGDIDNSSTGEVVVSGGGAVTFYDDITQNGTFRVSKVGSTTSVAVVLGGFTGSGGSTGGGDIFFEGDLRPGNSAATVTFENNIALGSGTTLQIELGGTNPGSQYDQIDVTGELALGGALDVLLIGGFMPTAGDSFNILDWGTIDATFDEVNLPSLGAGAAWDDTQLYVDGVLSVVHLLPGDYNLDGKVSAADYTVWRDTLGSTTDMRANGDFVGSSTGVIDMDDYDVWLANFGMTTPGAGSGATVGLSISPTPVPEPTAILLLLIGLVLAQRCGALPSGNVRLPQL